MSSRCLHALALLVPLVAGGCDVTGPERAARVRVSATLARRPEAPSVTAAWLVVDGLRLRPTGWCSVEVREPVFGDVTLSGPRAFDLLGGVSVEATDIPLGVYCGVDAALDTAAEIPGASGLRGVSWFVEGRRADGVGFLLRGGLDRTPSRWDVPVRLGVDGGEVVIDETVHELRLVFDAARLFEGVDLDLGVRGADGAIYIDAGHNGFLLAPFEPNVARAGTMLVE